jgi:hypothetical protein
VSDFLSNPELSESGTKKIIDAIQNEQNRIEMAEAADLGLSVIKMSTYYAYELLVAVRNVELFVRWMKLLSGLLRRHIPACLWFTKYMEENMMIVREIIMVQKEDEIRQAFAGLIT